MAPQKAQRTPAQEFEREIRSLTSGRHQLWQVFSDFCEMAALAYSNAVHLDQGREERYLKVVSRYTQQEVDGICRLLRHVIDGLDTDCDFLGEQFMRLELPNHWKGQFFTPVAISCMMAELTMDRELMTEQIREKGYITLQEPAAGAGANILGFAHAMLAAGFNPQRQLHVTAVDVDSTAAHMCYVQLSLLGIPAVVWTGNTLSMEMREAWCTPAHLLGDWSARLERGALPEDAPTTERTGKAA